MAFLGSSTPRSLKTGLVPSVVAWGMPGINNAGDTVEIVNTIVAQNIALTAERASDCNGTIASSGNNIIGTVYVCTIDLHATDFVGDQGLRRFGAVALPTSARSSCHRFG